MFDCIVGSFLWGLQISFLITAEVRIEIRMFLPPGSGSGNVIQSYGYGSGSFDHQAKIVRKTMIPTALRLLFNYFLSLKNDENQDPLVRGPDLDLYRVSKCHGSVTLDNSMFFSQFLVLSRPGCSPESYFGFEFICGFRFCQKQKLRKRCCV
jgi:hypothetical protein